MKRIISIIGFFCLAPLCLLRADLDWGSGFTQFQGNDEVAFDNASGLAVLVAVESGGLVDLGHFRPSELSDLVNAGRTWMQGDRVNHTLAVSTGFNSGFCFNATAGDVDREFMEALGVAQGAALYLVVWDRRTFVTELPVAGSQFAVTELFVDGVDLDPARAFGAELPNPPTLVYPNLSVGALKTSRAFSAVNRYALILNAEPEAGGAVLGDGLFDEGIEVSVTAVPNEGYRFEKWVGNGLVDDGANPATVSMNADRQVRAEFVKTWVLSIEISAGLGEVVASGVFDDGTSATISAVPSAGYRFVRWIGEGILDAMNAESAVLMDANRELLAEFELITVKPSITVQPVSFKLVAGASVTLSVLAEGVPAPSYQWRKGGVDIEGATAASFTIEAATLTDEADYDVVVSNVVDSVTSETAHVTVQAPPVISVQPLPQTVVVGDGVTLSVTANGVPAPNYQWRKGGVEIEGATGASFTIEAVSLADDADYDVVVGNVVDSVTSETAHVTVQAPVQITSQPQDQTVEAGANVTMEVGATGVPAPTYQWRKNGEVIDGATGSSILLTAVSLEDTGNYDVVVTNVVGNETSTPAVLTVHTLPAIQQQPDDQVVKEGQELSLSVVASGVPAPTYQWFRNGGAIDGATGSEFVVEVSGENDAGDYKVVITNEVGATESREAVVIVRQAPRLTAFPEAVTKIVGDSVLLGVAVTGASPLTYVWTKDGEIIAGVDGPELSLLSVSLEDDGLYAVSVSNDVGSVQTQPVRLTVHAAPTIGAQPVDTTITEGAKLQLSVVANGVPAPTYQWFKGGEIIEGATGSAYVVDPVNRTDAGSYTVRVENEVAAVVSEPVEVDVQFGPAVLTQPVSLTREVGSAASFEVEVEGNPTPTFEWRKAGEVVEGANAAVFNLAAVALADAGNYTVLVRNAIGEVESSTVTLTVTEQPKITAQPSPQTVNRGSAIELIVEASGTPEPSYQWRKDGVALPDQNGAALILSNATAEDAGEYDVVVSNSVGTVTSEAVQVTVQAAPTISSQPVGVTLVVGQPLTLSVVADGLPQPTYQWRLNGTEIEGETAAELTRESASYDDSGDYDVVVSNAVGTVTSSVASVEVESAPIILSDPKGGVFAVGGSIALSVEVDGTAPFTYQWLKDGSSIPEATMAGLSLSNLSLADAGNYHVTVSNSVGSTDSGTAQVAVVELAGTHSVVGNGYRAGETLTVTNTITYAGPLVSFGWSVLPPDTIDGQAWSFGSSGVGAGQVAPEVGDTELFEWAWTSTPASPIEFSYTLNVPGNVVGDQALVGILRARSDGEEVKVMVTPDPLVVSPAPSTHDADTDLNSEISLGELLRVIELYNTRNGTVRTGRYLLDAESVDGYGTDPETPRGSANELERHHSADTDQDAEISLGELLRVIELYNYREGTRRTGAYHVEAGTVDGFATGPEQ